MDSKERQDMLVAAVNFLQSPQVTSSFTEKLCFLKDKGLTETEIHNAIESAIAGRQLINSSSSAFSGILNALLLTGLAFGAHQAYKYYSEQKAQPSLTDIMNQVKELERAVSRNQQSFQTEIRSIKSLMLSKENFPTPQAIPAWQMLDKKDQPNEDGDSTIN